MGLARQGWASSGPEEKPADTSSRKVEGFYLGCRWIASPKDIPVPEKVLKRIERLRGGPMIESEKDIQILISEWQRMEFRRMKEQILNSEKNVITQGYQITSSGGNPECPDRCPVQVCPCEGYRGCEICGTQQCCCVNLAHPRDCPCSGWDCCIHYKCFGESGTSEFYKCQSCG
ncbi:MAG: hypothetical protein V2G48_07870 [bacterium JZ-2024 1]